MRHTLGELAARFGLELRGDPALNIDGVCSLAPGRPGCIAYLADRKHREHLGSSDAGAVIVGRRDAEALGQRAGLIADNALLAYVQIARLFDPDQGFAPGRHPSAIVAQDANLGAGCWVGALSVIEAGAQIGERSFIGPNCFVGRDARIGGGARLVGQVHVAARVRLGARCHIQAGAVIGSRGFGNTPGPQGWIEVPQLGSVSIGDDVEIGANTTIDRGAIDDTVIGDGVKLDNQIQIAHNCRIGAHTAIAACTGIAGSTTVGARCMIGGAVGISGHIAIGDDVVILAMAMVTKGIPDKGVYGSGMPVAAARDWRKQIARLRRLENTEARLQALEQHLGLESRKGAHGDGDDEADI